MHLSQKYIGLKCIRLWWRRVNSFVRYRIFCCVLLVRAVHRFDSALLINWILNRWRPVESDKGPPTTLARPKLYAWITTSTCYWQFKATVDCDDTDGDGGGKDENWLNYDDGDSSVLRHCALSTGELLPVFRRDVVPSSSLSGSLRTARRSSLLGLPEPENRGATFNP